MKITYAPDHKKKLFEDVQPGEMFSNDRGDGLFLKIISNRDNNNTVVVDPLKKVANPIKKGKLTCWGENSYVIPVSTLHVGLEHHKG